MLASLLCHDEVKVCRVDVTPTLPVRDLDEATGFCEAAGFDVERYDDGFGFVRLGDQSVFSLDRIDGLDPASNHAGCYIITDYVEGWYGRLVAAELQVSAIEDMPWGMHEFTLTDPSGNSIRIGRSTSNGESS